MPQQLPAAVQPIPKSVAQAGSPDASKAMTLFVMVVATLYFGREVLVPVTLALLLTFILAPFGGTSSGACTLDGCRPCCWASLWRLASSLPSAA